MYNLDHGHVINPMDEVVQLRASFDEFEKCYNLLRFVQFHCLVVPTKPRYELILSFLLLLGEYAVILLRTELFTWLK